MIYCAWHTLSCPEHFHFDLFHNIISIPYSEIFSYGKLRQRCSKNTSNGWRQFLVLVLLCVDKSVVVLQALSARIIIINSVFSFQFEHFYGQSQGQKCRNVTFKNAVFNHIFFSIYILYVILNRNAIK